MLGFGLKLEASGDPIKAAGDGGGDQTRRLHSAMVEIQLLETDASRVTKVKELSGVIGLGGHRKPQTHDEHAAFGRHIINVSMARLKKLEVFQEEVATWFTTGHERQSR